MLNILDPSYSISIRRESGAVYQHCFKNCNDLHQSVEVVFADVNSQLDSSAEPITFIVPLRRAPDSDDLVFKIPALSYSHPQRCFNVGDVYSLDAAGFARALPDCTTAAPIPRLLLATLQIQSPPVNATIEATPIKPHLAFSTGIDHAPVENCTPMQRTTTRPNLLHFTPQKTLLHLTAAELLASHEEEEEDPLAPAAETSSDLLSLDDDTDSVIDDAELEFQQQAAIRALQEGNNLFLGVHMGSTAAAAAVASPTGGICGDNFGGSDAVPGSGAGTTAAAAVLPPCGGNHSPRPSTPGPSTLLDSHLLQPSSQQLLLSPREGGPSETDFLRAWETLKEQQQRQAPPQLRTPIKDGAFVAAPQMWGTPQKKRKSASNTAESEVDAFCRLFTKPPSREQQLEAELLQAQFELQKQRLGHCAAVNDMRSFYEARIQLLEAQAQVAEERAQLQRDAHEAAMVAMQEELRQAQGTLMRQQQAASRQMQRATDVAEAAQAFLAAMDPQDCLNPEASVAVDNC